MTKTKILFGLFVISLVSGCSESPPNSIKDITDEILSVTKVPNDGAIDLRISLKPHGAANGGASYFFNATNASLATLRGIRTYFPQEDAARVIFEFVAPLTDQYGNKSDDKIIEINYDMADVKKINFSNQDFTGWDLLKLSRPIRYVHPAGRGVVRDYCSEETHQKYATVFCLKSL